MDPGWTETKLNPCYYKYCPLRLVHLELWHLSSSLKMDKIISYSQYTKDTARTGKSVNSTKSISIWHLSSLFPLQGHLFVSLKCWSLRRESAVHVFETRWNSRPQISYGQSHTRSDQDINQVIVIMVKKQPRLLPKRLPLFLRFLVSRFPSRPSRVLES